jgi:hypothetical protein
MHLIDGCKSRKLDARTPNPNISTKMSALLYFRSENRFLVILISIIPMRQNRPISFFFLLGRGGGKGGIKYPLEGVVALIPGEAYWDKFGLKPRSLQAQPGRLGKLRGSFVASISNLSLLRGAQ